MLTKGIIIDRVGNDNHYLVRIPILENANDVEHSIVEATLAYTSGIVESFKPDDVVVVGFENHSPDSPIIVGKLFLQEDVNEPRGFANLESLNVSKSVVLPEDTTIAGQSLKNLPNLLETLQIDEEVDVDSKIAQALTPSATGMSQTKAIDSYTGATFTIGSDYQGIYIFTYGNCMIPLILYGMQESVDYKTSAALLNSLGSYQVKVLTYRKEGTTLKIFNKESFIPTGYVAYLFKVKLY